MFIFKFLIRMLYIYLIYAYINNPVYAREDLKFNCNLGIRNM